MPLFQPDDGLLLVVVWSVSQTTGPRFALIGEISGSDDTYEISGDDVPSSDPIKIPAGAGVSIRWRYNGTISLVGKGLVFTAKDPNGVLVAVKMNAVAGGSEDDFTTPPLGDDGLPIDDPDAPGKKAGGFINLHGMDSRTARRAIGGYDVAISDPSAPDDPSFPSIGAFEVTDHASV